MKNSEDLIWGALIGLLLTMAGAYLFFYTIYSLNGNPQATVADIMAHWPQLERVPSLKGLRGEVGGQQLPDSYSLEKLPKAGIVWPCGDGSEFHICYLMADGSKPDVNRAVDLADRSDKYIFRIQKGGDE